MFHTRTSLSFRVRYEGRVQTFDRRPLKEAQAEDARGGFRYMVAHTLSPFRPKWEVRPSTRKAVAKKKDVTPQIEPLPALPFAQAYLAGGAR